MILATEIIEFSCPDTRATLLAISQVVVATVRLSHIKKYNHPATRTTLLAMSQVVVVIVPSNEQNFWKIMQLSSNPEHLHRQMLVVVTLSP